MFTKELLLEENVFFTLDESKIIIFEENNKGIISENGKEISFSWKINKKGVLIVKFYEKTHWFKLVKESEPNLEVSHYNKIDEDFVKINSYKVHKDYYTEEKEDFEKNFINGIKKDFLKYSKLNYSLFFAISFIVFLILISIMNLVIFVKDLNWVLKTICSFIIIFNIKEYIIILGLHISKIIKDKKNP